MAHKGQTLLFICSRCRYQLDKRTLGGTRAFTNTSQRSRAIPSFSPTSSPELDEIFSTFRQKVFTPHALAQHHRDLIYKKSRHSILLNDPGVTVTLSNDEEIRLMPMEPREKPNKKKSLQRVADLLGESSESERWTNFPSFLEGMRMAKEELPIEWWEKMARKANMVGKTGIIKLCAEMVKKTGASLSIPEMTRELMLGYHMQAVKEDFTGESLEKTLRSAEQVFSMMNDKEHCAGKISQSRKDMRKDPIVLGVLLELNAYKAINLTGGEDVGGRVAALVSRLLVSTEGETWAEQKDERFGQSTGWIVLWNGMRKALQIDAIAQGPNASELRSMTETIERAIRRVQRAITEETIERPGEEDKKRFATEEESRNLSNVQESEQSAAESTNSETQAQPKSEAPPAIKENRPRGRRFLQMLEEVEATAAR